MHITLFCALTNSLGIFRVPGLAVLDMISALSSALKKLKARTQFCLKQSVPTTKCIKSVTKRAEQLTKLDKMLPWTDNIWMGVTVESADYVYRIDHLRESRSLNKFISFEPLLGSVGTLNLKGIDLVIAGGESGPGARTVQKEWITEIRDQCVEAGIPFPQTMGRRSRKAAILRQGHQAASA
jgi:protein gp37